MPKRRQTLKKTSHFRRLWSESAALGHGPAPGHVPGRSATKGDGTGAVPQLVDGVFYFIFGGFSATRARARFREVVFHGTKGVENEFRVSEMYLGVRGSSRVVAESDLAFFGLAGPVTTAVYIFVTVAMTPIWRILLNSAKCAREREKRIPHPRILVQKIRVSD